MAVMATITESIKNIIRSKKQKQAFHIPPGIRVYAIGDIHGRADLLQQLHEMIIHDVESTDTPAENKVVYLGDYLDRGPYAKETIEEVLSGLPADFSPEYLRGNHEDLFLHFLEDASVLDVWLGLGGQATLLNYGIQAPGSGFDAKRAEDVREAFLDAVPSRHLEFLKTLKPFVQIGDFFFVHAGIRPGIPLQKQSEDDLFWIRDDFLESKTDHGAKIVHGHTISNRVQQHPNRIGLDTGAYATGILTCAVMEEDRIRFLSTTPESQKNH